MLLKLLTSESSVVLIFIDTIYIVYNKLFPLSGLFLYNSLAVIKIKEIIIAKSDAVIVAVPLVMAIPITDQG